MTNVEKDLLMKALRPKDKEIVVSVSKKAVSEEQMIKSMNQLYAGLKAYRLRREKDQSESFELAKHYRCR